METSLRAWLVVSWEGSDGPYPGVHNNDPLTVVRGYLESPVPRQVKSVGITG